MQRILLVFGTRPELIKLAPVYQELSRRSDFAVETMWTGQHRELVEGLTDFFGLDIHHSSEVMHLNGLASKTGRMLQDIVQLLERQRFDWIVVQGDTVSAMAGAKAGFLQGIPVAHVEAGLRTWDLGSPWPEEFNRRVISLCASLHFAPTDAAKRNLLAEGYEPQKIRVTGNTVVDALKSAAERVRVGYSPINATLNWLPTDKKLVLVTGHRRENFGTPLKRIVKAIGELADDGDKCIVFPVHLNPNVKNEVFRCLTGKQGVFLVEPLQYPDFVWLLSRAWLVITDSGGIQEEAPTFKIPIIITRESTERPEVVEAGFGHLAGSDQNLIVSLARQLTSSDTPTYARGENPFGQGDAAARIAHALAASFGAETAFQRPAIDTPELPHDAIAARAEVAAALEGMRLADRLQPRITAQP